MNNTFGYASCPYIAYNRLAEPKIFLLELLHSAKIRLTRQPGVFYIIDPYRETRTR